MTPEHAQCNAKQDVQFIKEQNVSHAEQRLKTKPKNQNLMVRQRQRWACDTTEAAAYLDGETVSEEGEEPREADRGDVDAELEEVRRELRHALLHVVEQHERARAQTSW